MRLSRLLSALVALTVFSLSCKDSNHLTGPGLGKTFTISGTVTKFGHPAGGVVVAVQGFGGATTAADGTFSVHNVPAGTWTLIVQTGCIACAEFSIDVTVPPDASGLHLEWVED
jgi:hypothetical protein